MPGTLLVGVQRFKVPEEFNHLAEERDQQEESVWDNQGRKEHTAFALKDRAENTEFWLPWQLIIHKHVLWKGFHQIA